MYGSNYHIKRAKNMETEEGFNFLFLSLVPSPNQLEQNFKKN